MIRSEKTETFRMEFSKEWRHAVDRVKKSGADLSRIYLVGADKRKSNYEKFVDAYENGG